MCVYPKSLVSLLFRKISSVLLLASFLVASSAHAVDPWPKRLILIRHAEDDDHTGLLLKKGQDRAEALSLEFAPGGDLSKKYGEISAIYACKQKNSKAMSHSMQTVKPLSDVLHLPIQAPHIPQKAAEMADVLLADANIYGKTAIVAWTHENLANLAHALGVKPRPDDWDNKVFDRMWILDFSPSKKGTHAVVSFRSVPESVLPGDSSH